MRKFITLCLMITCMLLYGVVAFATTQPTGDTNKGTDTYNANTVDKTLINNENTKEPSFSDVADAGIPKVSIDQASEWAERKGNDIVRLLQRFVQPFATVIFIVCAFLTLLGAFGNSQLVGRGVFGMFIAVIMYAVVLYAPELLDFILGWLRS